MKGQYRGGLGGGQVSARYVRQDYFTFRTHCQLVFVGIHNPLRRELEDGQACRTRIPPLTSGPNPVNVIRTWRQC